MFNFSSLRYSLIPPPVPPGGGCHVISSPRSVRLGASFIIRLLPCVRVCGLLRGWRVSPSVPRRRVLGSVVVGRFASFVGRLRNAPPGSSRVCLRLRLFPRRLAMRGVAVFRVVFRSTIVAPHSPASALHGVASPAGRGGVAALPPTALILPRAAAFSASPFPPGRPPHAPPPSVLSHPPSRPPKGGSPAHPSTAHAAGARAEIVAIPSAPTHPLAPLPPEHRPRSPRTP